MMFGWLSRKLAARKQATFRDQLAQRLLARYDAAATTDENKRHWAAADALSSNGANSRGIRTQLRNRSRYECANNSYANGMARTLAYHMVGTGPTLSIEGEEPFDRQVEDRFTAWAKACDLAGKLRTMRETRVRDGEVFCLLTTNPQLGDRVKLDVRPIEADQVGVPGMSGATGWGGMDSRDYCDGIHYDEAGNPTRYDVLNAHPGDPWYDVTYRTIDARYVCHWYRSDRPDQRRGIPEITPALPLYAILRRYTLATLSTAEIAAMMSVFLRTTSSAIDVAAVDPWDLVEINRNTMTTLPDGWDVQQLKAEQPTTQFDAFTRTILREIARCLDMPFNIAAGDSSGYNYSSGRLDHQTYFRAISIDREHCERRILDRIYAAWFDEALVTDGYFTEPRTSLTLPEAAWDWPPFEHVDPMKESAATANDLAYGLTSIPTEHARRGRRWEREFARQARAMGITLAEYQQAMRAKILGAPPVQAPDPIDTEDEMP